MEEHCAKSLNTSLVFDTSETSQVENRKKSQRLEECLEVLIKPEGMRSAEEIEQFAQTLVNLGIFDKSVTENIEPISFISAIMPYIKYETYSAGMAIVHYNYSHEKLCIIARGKAKEFVPRTPQELENERKNKQTNSLNNFKQENTSLTDLDDDYRSSPNKQRTCIQTKSLACIIEEHEPDPSPALRRKPKPQESKGVTPLTVGLMAPISCLHDPFEDMKYEILDSLRITGSSCSRGDEEADSLGGTLNDLDEENTVSPSDLNEFNKFPKNYFNGGILKVKYSRMLGASDFIGLKSLGKRVISKEAVIAAEECHCICLYKDDYQAVLENERKVHSEKIEFFKKLFPNFKDDIVTSFSLLWEEQLYKRGDVIFHEKEASDYFVVFQGEITISKDTSLPVLARKNSDDMRKLKKKNTSILQIATFCHGYFFEEGSSEGKVNALTTTVSSSKARVFRLSSKDKRLVGDRYSQLLERIKGSIRLATQLNAQRLEYLSQVQNTEENQYTKQSQENIPPQEELRSKEASETSFTPLVRQVKKVKSIDLRHEYGKYFVCKPGQKHPEYLQKILNIDKETCLTEGNEQTEASFKKGGSMVVDMNATFTSPPKSSQTTERVLNFLNVPGQKINAFTLAEEQLKKEEISLKSFKLVARNNPNSAEKMRTFYNRPKGDNRFTMSSTGKFFSPAEPRKQENTELKGQDKQIFSRVIQGRNIRLSSNRSNTQIEESIPMNIMSAFETGDGRVRCRDSQRVVLQRKGNVKPVTSSLNDLSSSTSSLKKGQGRVLRGQNEGRGLPMIKSPDSKRHDSLVILDACHSFQETTPMRDSEKVRGLKKW